MIEKTVDIYKELTILIVDDNKTTLQIYKAILEDMFKNVLLAEDASNGLELFKTHSCDLIITDYDMPGMNGLEFISHIREYNMTVPIVFVSSSKDYDVYQKAINLNVTHSLIKPFNAESITNILEKIIEPVCLYHLSISSVKDELKNLKDQKKYQLAQEHNAFLKEHQAIRNDFYYSYYKHPSQDNFWYLDGSYRPFDILSGDTYSIRKIDENRSFFFIIDAMGKGVSASVTSILASSYINHYVDEAKGDFDLKEFISDFNRFILKNLLDEEVLAVVFAKIDFAQESMSISSYGMPPILFYDKNEKLLKIKTKNTPISKHNNTFYIDTHNIRDIQKMLFYSDGLVESKLDNGELYFSHLKNDFSSSKNRSSFLKKLYTKVPSPDDDITLLFFQRVDLSYKEMIRIKCLSSLKNVEKVIFDFHEYLKENKVDERHTAKLGMIFTEMMMNAYEHGNLNISNKKKKELISNGELESECHKRETLYGSRTIKINYLISAHGEGKDIRFDIEDEGEGFDTKIFKKLVFDRTSVNGRGFKIAKMMVDAIYYSPKGNHVILHKYIPKEI